MIKPSASTNLNSCKIDRFSLPDENGRFGPYGGSFVPKHFPIHYVELNDAYLVAKKILISKRTRVPIEGFCRAANQTLFC